MLNSIPSSVLSSVTNFLDAIARKGKHRFVRDKHLGIAHGEYILKQLLALYKFDMVFDIGGNIGQYGLHLRNNLGYKESLVSFEPIPKAADQIRVAARLDSKWHVKQYAIDVVRGQTSFNVTADSQFSSLLFPNEQFSGRFCGNNAVCETISVETFTLNEAVNDTPSFERGLLKLDTQGTEIRIIAAGIDSLKLFPAIQIEIGFQTIYEGQNNYLEAITKLNELEYRLCALFPNNEGHFPHLLEMDAVFLHKSALEGI